jgi:hypothetical protein
MPTQNNERFEAIWRRSALKRRQVGTAAYPGSVATSGSSAPAVRRSRLPRRCPRILGLSKFRIRTTDPSRTRDRRQPDDRGFWRNAQHPGRGRGRGGGRPSRQGRNLAARAIAPRRREPDRAPLFDRRCGQSHTAPFAAPLGWDRAPGRSPRRPRRGAWRFGARPVSRQVARADPGRENCRRSA